MGKGGIPFRRTKPFIAAVEAEGCELIQITVTGGGHFGYRVRYGDRERTFHSGGTPGDMHAHKCFARDIRRWRLNREDNRKP